MSKKLFFPLPYDTELMLLDDSGAESAPTAPNVLEIADVVPEASKTTQRSGGRRTHRACDRCRVKKSKCNGQQPCNTCKTNERTCVFSALRRRDIRKWHCHMQDTIDEAIQRLYRACKESANFPGVLPEEKGGYVTTEQILDGMGFTNLDLGPRSAGIPGLASLQSLPNRTRFNHTHTEGDMLSNSNRPLDNRMSPTSSSDSASVSTSHPFGSARTQTSLNMSGSLQEQYYPHLSGAPHLVKSHFSEVVSGSNTSPGSHHRDIPSQNFEHPFPYLPQRNVPEGFYEHSGAESFAPTPYSPVYSSLQSDLSMKNVGQQSYPQYVTHSIVPFINTPQMWFGHAG